MLKSHKLIFIVAMVFSINTAASDLAKEKRWADQVVDSIMDGDAVWLKDGTGDYLGIYTEAEEDKKRAVIVMHGTGIHPDWQQVIQPLRVGLTEHNWYTLSIQMPILANDAEYDEYAPLYDEVAPRIDAAIEYLKEKGISNIVLLGHSQGSSMTAYYLSSSKKDVKGFVAIGMAAFGKDKRMNSIYALEKIKVPVFDLYGTEDLENVLASANKRKSAAKKAGNKEYAQSQIKGDHFFDGEEENLVRVVAEWLERI